MSSDTSTAPSTGSATAEGPLLSRLNRRGFRLLMVLDTGALYLLAVAIMVARFGTRWPAYPTALYLGSFAVSTAIFVASLYFGGLYEREPRLGAPPVLPRAVRQTLAAGGLVALLNLSLTGAARSLGVMTQRALPFPTQNLLWFIALAAVVVAVDRRVAMWLRTRREGPPKVVVVGDADQLDVARAHLAAADGHVRVVAELTGPDEVVDAVAQHEATDVVLLAREWLDPLYPAAVERLERAGVTVLLRVTARETMFGLERLREVGGLPFVLLRSQTIPRSRARFKRAFDLGWLALAAPVWVPVLAATALYQLAVAGRPLLYWQTRVGASGRPFRMVKFRTMTVDAEADGQGARLAATEDPRVIPACRWIRATRLDELPQLWNVARGEMSLVGPRPERPELTAAFEADIPGYARRHEVPPGLTGLAQIHGRYHTDAEYKLGYDLQYLVNWSPVLDLQILVRTLWVVVTRRI